jgi:hypothetical protein
MHWGSRKALPTPSFEKENEETASAKAPAARAGVYASGGSAVEALVVIGELEVIGAGQRVLFEEALQRVVTPAAGRCE